MIDGESPRNKRVVVVGAGLGGLAAAASLRAEGFEVRVVEKNERIGGKLNFREIDGYGFDLGPSIFTCRSSSRASGPAPGSGWPTMSGSRR